MEHPKIPVKKGWGRCCQQETCCISETGQDYFWWLVGSCILAFDWYQNQWPWMKSRAFSEPVMKLRMKVYLYYQRQWCSQMTLFSGNIMYMQCICRCLQGFPGDGESNDWGNWKRRFSNISHTMSSEPFKIKPTSLCNIKYLVSRCLSTFSKTRDLERSWMAFFTLNSVFDQLKFKIYLFTYMDSTKLHLDDICRRVMDIYACRSTRHSKKAVTTSCSYVFLVSCDELSLALGILLTRCLLFQPVVYSG